MKAKLIFSLVLMGMAATSFGSLLVANFEGDGLDLGYGGGTIVTGTGNTLGNNSYRIDAAAGWWNGTWEVYVGGASSNAKTALATVGTVMVDVTATNADGWANLGLLINAGGTDGMWNPVQWLSVVASGSSQTLTFQIPADVMVRIPNFDSYFNLGFLNGTNSATTYYFDNVRIVPEPATMLMLGLGGLSLIRRKR
jgi:hypothetical protein